MVMTSETAVKHAQACLLGGAIGDALGAPVEFMSAANIIGVFGDQGIRDYHPEYGRLGAITDDTQMTLFTAEGLIRGIVRGHTYGMASIPSVIHHALCRWLLTQGIEPGEPNDPIRSNIDRQHGLIQDRRLWSSRAPGNTCLSSLRSVKDGFGSYAINQSKGCGGVMRVAPCAFYGDAFENASQSARMTHGHPTGYLSAGLFAHILQELFHSDKKDKTALLAIVHDALERYQHREGMAETHRAITTVVMFVNQGMMPSPRSIDEFGRGWIAEEALAISLWCALSADSFEEGLIMAVNHSGDSDSTGSIAGNLLGLMYGLAAIPSRWLESLELKDVIERIAADLIDVPHQCWQQGEDLDGQVFERYPGY
jgi:ADP-ribosylglycohydrolase